MYRYEASRFLYLQISKIALFQNISEYISVEMYGQIISWLDILYTDSEQTGTIQVHTP